MRAHGKKRFIAVTLFLALVISPLGGQAVRAAASQRAPSPPAPTASAVAISSGALPLSFEPNVGQADPSVAFLTRGSGGTLFLTGQQMVLSIPNQPSHSSQPADGPALPIQNPQRDMHLTTPMTSTAVGMQYLHANPHPQIVGLDKLPGVVNYFTTSSATRWLTDVPTYARIEYQNLYPGIDLQVYGEQRRTEYDWVVAPNADPTAIQMGVEGAAGAQLDAGGDLVQQAGGVTVRHQHPSIYQMENGQRRPVGGGWRLKGDRQAGFVLGAYDHSQPLVIDPGLIYGTYLGGSDNDEARSVAVDGSGDAIVAGITMSTDFPVADALDGTFVPGWTNVDTFVCELNSAGTALLFSTYITSSFNNNGPSLALDSSDNVYLTGNTEYTSQFPTTPGAFQSQFPGGYMVPFVTELNSAGDTLLYSTYVGGSGGSSLSGGASSSWGTAIAVDNAGNAYVAGYTDDPSFPTTSNSYLPTYNVTNLNGYDAFVAKLNAGGSALVYSTFLGGTNDQQAWSIAVDSGGQAYVAGETASTDFPTTAGAPQPQYVGGYYTGFVTSLNAAGTGLLHSTYVGGTTANDAANKVVLDNDDDAYVTGRADSSDFPVTAGAWSASQAGGDGFAAKFSSSGRLLYATYLAGADSGQSLTVDASGNAIITGNTGSSDMPTTSDAVQQSKAADYDAYLLELNPTGSSQIYGTYLGGNGYDTGEDVTVGSDGYVYLVGATSSTDFPTTGGAAQGTYDASAPFGPTDGFVVKLNVPSVYAAPQCLAQGCQTPSSPTTGAGTQYTITPKPSLYYVTGTQDTGNHCQGCSTQIDLPFPFTLYSTTYSSASVSSNGHLDLGATPDTTAASNSVLPDPTGQAAIFPYWDDLRTDTFQGDGSPTGIYTLTSGSAPNRTFTIEWRAALYSTGEDVDVEVQLHEGSTGFDVNYDLMPQPQLGPPAGDADPLNGAVGVQDSSGSSYTQYTGIDLGRVGLHFDLSDAPPLPESSASAQPAMSSAALASMASLSSPAAQNIFGVSGSFASPGEHLKSGVSGCNPDIVPCGTANPGGAVRVAAVRALGASYVRFGVQLSCDSSLVAPTDTSLVPRSTEQLWWNRKFDLNDVGVHNYDVLGAALAAGVDPIVDFTPANKCSASQSTRLAYSPQTWAGEIARFIVDMPDYTQAPYDVPNDHSRTIYFEIGNEMDNTPSLFSLTSCPSDPNTSPVPDAYLACYPDIFGQSAQDIEGNLNVLKTEPSWAWMKGYRILTGAMSVPTAALGPNANIDKAIAAITEAENAYGVSSSVLGTAVHPYGYATSLPQAWPHFSMVKYTKVVPVTIPVWGLSPEMANGQYVYDTITGQRLTIWDIVGETTIDFPAACRCTTWFRPQSIRNFIRLDTMLRLWTGDPADTSGDSAYAAGYTALTGLPLIFTEDNWNANYEPAGWDAMNLSPDWQLTAAYMVDVFTWLARNGEINPSRNIDIKNYADVATSPVRVLMFSGADSASSAGDWPRGLYTYAGSTKPIPPASQYTCHAQWVTDVATAFQLAAKAPCF